MGRNAQRETTGEGVSIGALEALIKTIQCCSPQSPEPAFWPKSMTSPPTVSANAEVRPLCHSSASDLDSNMEKWQFSGLAPALTEASPAANASDGVNARGPVIRDAAACKSVKSTESAMDKVASKTD